jgi:hypothetical protein
VECMYLFIFLNQNKIIIENGALVKVNSSHILDVKFHMKGKGLNVENKYLFTTIENCEQCFWNKICSKDNLDLKFIIF